MLRKTLLQDTARPAYLKAGRSLLPLIADAVVSLVGNKRTLRGRTPIGGMRRKRMRTHEPVNAVVRPSEPTARASSVYCRGELLEAVQGAHLFNDCKDFVDMPMKMDPEAVMESFKLLKAQWGGVPYQFLSTEQKESLRHFVYTHFHAPGSDLVPAQLPDFKQFPSLLQKISNESLRQWATQVNQIWNTLGRQVSPDVAKDPQRYSLLYAKHPLVVPGGRFRETYYWDTYWIVEGLLSCDMASTARGVVQNLLDQCEAYGFVPNGGRVYYLNRSQPPMLSEMVKRVYEASKDNAFLLSAFAVLEKEYRFWMQSQRAVAVQDADGHSHVLNRFYSEDNSPRPESYREDIETAYEIPERCANDVYRNLRAGAETGWDYSSRWFRDHMTLKTIDTCNIIPVDLNSMLYRMEMNMARFAKILAEAESHAPAGAASSREFYLDKRTEYVHNAQRRKHAITQILWDAEENHWRDVWIENDGLSKKATRANVTSVADYMPLWAGAFDATKVNIPGVLDSLDRSGLLLPGGLVTTTAAGTGQQWDYPNAWAPLQAMMIEGLARTRSAKGRALAYQLAEQWINTCFTAFSTSVNGTTSLMFEKYDCSSVGKGGAGGEYEPQTGFGWTNGVALNLLEKFGSVLWTPQEAGFRQLLTSDLPTDAIRHAEVPLLGTPEALSLFAELHQEEEGEIPSSVGVHA